MRITLTIENQQDIRDAIKTLTRWPLILPRS